MNPALAFGERVSSFIFRETALLKITPSIDPIHNSTVSIKLPRSIEALGNVVTRKKKPKKDKTTTKDIARTPKSNNNETEEWSSRAITHAKLIQSQLVKA